MFWTNLVCVGNCGVLDAPDKRGGHGITVKVGIARRLIDLEVYSEGGELGFRLAFGGVGISAGAGT